jgi:uncharacterized Rossmann fold enzyme
LETVLPEQQLTIWCSLTGDWPGGNRELGEKYVRILRDALTVHLKVPYTFKCLTDKLVDGVDCVIDSTAPASWWNKLWLFTHARTGRNLYFDLDTLLVGNIATFVEKLVGQRFALQRDLSPMLKDRYNSALFYWEGDHADIFKTWDERGRPLDFGTGGKYDDTHLAGGIVGSDNAWLEYMRPNAPYIQTLCPGVMVSYKHEAQHWDAPHTNTPIVCFHGRPRPHEVAPDAALGAWVPKVWQEYTGSTDYSQDLTIWCSLTGTWPDGDRALGEHYVRVLKDMVDRSLFAGPGGKKYPFKCLTDAPIEGIDCVIEPDAPASWWNKVWLFKHARTGRNFYIDLDTVITGRLEPLVDAMRGHSFLNMRDLLPRDLVTTGLFYWEGDHSDIYERYVSEDQTAFMASADNWKDRNGIGDGAWFAHCRPDAKWLQDVLPEGAVQSYKWTQMHHDWPSDETAIVCFHGLPRPHHVQKGWAPKVWCIGGLGKPAWISIINTGYGQILENVETNRKDPNAQQLQEMLPQKPEDKVLIICGGGPSLGDADALKNIKIWTNLGADVWALNGAYSFLQDQGIVPSGMVMMDARLENVRFLDKLHGRTTFYVATVCNPVVFQRLERHNVMAWTPATEGVTGPLLIGGGSSVGTRALALAVALGYRKFHLYGFDSSYREVAGKPEGHAFKQELNDGELDIVVSIHEREFHCARWMARQCEQLRGIVRQLVEDFKCEVHVFGDGLFPYAIALDSATADEPTLNPVE